MAWCPPSALGVLGACCGEPTCLSTTITFWAFAPGFVLDSYPKVGAASRGCQLYSSCNTIWTGNPPFNFTETYESPSGQLRRVGPVGYSLSRDWGIIISQTATITATTAEYQIVFADGTYTSVLSGPMNEVDQSQTLNAMAAMVDYNTIQANGTFQSGFYNTSNTFQISTGFLASLESFIVGPTFSGQNMFQGLHRGRYLVTNCFFPDGSQIPHVGSETWRLQPEITGSTFAIGRRLTMGPITINTPSYNAVSIAAFAGAMSVSKFNIVNRQVRTHINAGLLVGAGVCGAVNAFTCPPFVSSQPFNPASSVFVALPSGLIVGKGWARFQCV